MLFDFGKNHFELFGLAPVFHIDMERLDQAYREIQVQIHPDKFAHLGEQEQRMAMQWTTHANEAYQILKRPLSRARYLLQLRGVDIQEDSNTVMPAEFLMEQMEWREAVAEPAKPAIWTAWSACTIGCVAKCAKCDRQLELTLDRQADYPAAAGLVRKLKFMERLGEEIDQALEALEA